MAKRRSQLVVYESKYLVDSVNQNETSQSYYKLSCGDIVGDSRREHCSSCGSEKRLWMALNHLAYINLRHADSAGICVIA